MLLLVHMPEQLQRDAGSSLRPCSFRCTTVHSGNGRGTLAAGPTGKSRFSSSESVRSSASGQVIPAAAALVTYSRTVLCAIARLRAIARLDWRAA
jgi:hypothetical protein